MLFSAMCCTPEANSAAAASLPNFLQKSWKQQSLMQKASVIIILVDPHSPFEQSLSLSRTAKLKHESLISRNYLS